MGEPSASNSELLLSRIRRLRERLRAAPPFLLGVLAALVAFLLFNLFFLVPGQLSEDEVNDAIASALASATPRPPYSVQVYQAIQPSLVMIQTKSRSSDGNLENSLGSGVVINDLGDIVTSLHVVEDATELVITFADGTKSDGFVVSSQPEIDIAILRTFDLPGLLVPAILGSPNSVRVGDEAFVVGHPFGLYSSMSAGVISGFDRTFQPPRSDQVLRGLIQIDAAVNPGNSGGPLLNRNGHVIGIITGIINPTDQSFFVGIGFAVPINVAAGGAGLPPY